MRGLQRRWGFMLAALLAAVAGAAETRPNVVLSDTGDHDWSEIE